MYINAGIGSEKGLIRFYCPPEITMFILHPAT